jgi:anti-anti-sigma factor
MPSGPTRYNKPSKKLSAKGLIRCCWILSEVVYISSAGLGVLVSAQKQFQSIRGTFGVKDTDGPVGEVIRLTGLSKMLLWNAQVLSGSIVAPPGAIQAISRMVYAKHADFTVYDLEPDAKWTGA